MLLPWEPSSSPKHTAPRKIRKAVLPVAVKRKPQFLAIKGAV
jgi:hypothetical protein